MPSQDERPQRSDPLMKATRLDIRHNPYEDRLVLIASGAGAAPAALALTRRLTRAIIGKLIELLMNSSPDISRTAAAHREDVLLFEHVAAVSSAQADPASGGGAPTEPPPPEPESTLLIRVDFTPTAPGLVMRFSDAAGPRCELALSRTQVHQLLSILARKAREAEWDFGELGWIDRRMHVVVPEGSSVS